MDDKNIMACIAVSAAVKYVVMLRYRRPNQEWKGEFIPRPSSAEYVGFLSEINIYPVKSCQGLAVDEVLCTSSGVQYDNTVLDRHFMVADSTGKFVSQRRYPKMALIKTSISDCELLLDAPDMDTLKLPLSLNGQSHQCDVWGNDLYGIDCGDDAAAWITTYLQASLRMFFTDPTTQTLNMAASGKKQWHKATRPHDKTGFQDFAPIMLANSSSLDELNTRLENAVDMRRFRPNFTVTGPSAFDEDKWCEIFIGSDTRFTTIKPCTRCNMVTVNPDTGTKDSDNQPFKTLNQYRVSGERDLTAPCFGLHLVLDFAGKVKVGDAVYAVRGPNWWQK